MYKLDSFSFVGGPPAARKGNTLYKTNGRRCRVVRGFAQLGVATADAPHVPCTHPDAVATPAAIAAAPTPAAAAHSRHLSNYRTWCQHLAAALWSSAGTCRQPRGYERPSDSELRNIATPLHRLTEWHLTTSALTGVGAVAGRPNNHKYLFVLCFWLYAALSAAQLSLPIHFKPMRHGASDSLYVPLPYLRFLETAMPIGFGTFEEGELGVAFVVDGLPVWRLRDWHLPPKPTQVWPDLVVLSGEPVAGCEATMTYWYHSAGLWLYDVTVANTGNRQMQVEAITTYRLLNNAWTHAHRATDYNSVFLELADSADVIEFAQYKPADGILAWNANDSTAPQTAAPPLTQTDLLSGQIFTPNRVPARTWPQFFRLQLATLGYPDTIYTENNRSVFQMFHDGSLLVRDAVLPKSNRTHRLAAYRITDEALGYEFLLPQRQQDFSLYLGIGRLPEPVDHLRLETSAGKIKLTWSEPIPGLYYQVYQRQYPHDCYVRVAHNLRTNTWEMPLPSGAPDLGFVVVSANAAGLISIQSPEVSTRTVVKAEEVLANPRNFIGRDVLNNPPHWLKAQTLQGVGLYNSWQLEAQAKAHVRGFVSHGPMRATRLSKQDLYLILSTDWAAILKEREN